MNAPVTAASGPHRALRPSPGASVLPAAALALFAAAALLIPRPARACSVCGCGDPLLIATDPAAIAGVLRLQLDADYLQIDAANDADPAATDQLTQSSLRLNAVWRPSDRLSFSATVPVLHKVIVTSGAGPDVTASDLSGLGDVDLGVRYALWRSVQVGQQRAQELAVTAGTSAPTGQSQATDAGGALIDPHGQLGTGAWGPFAGIHYRYEQGPWTGYASASFRVRTEASYPDPAGTMKYKFGNAFLWSAHGQYLATKGLALDLGLDGRTARQDTATEPGGLAAPVDNTGGTVISAAPSVYWNPAGALWLFLRVQVPVYKDLVGRQDVFPSGSIGLQFQVL
jgi:hypothetical protein